MKKVLYIFASILFAVSLITCVKIRLNNPDMTEMRLWLTYWKTYLMSIATGLAWYWLIFENRRI